MDNRAGQAQAHCNLGYALMCECKHKLSHWHYTLARDLAKETAWETVQIQAEAALNVLETPNFPHNTIISSPAISICPSMARLQCQGDSKTPSLSSPPSVKAKRKEKKGRRRVAGDREKPKAEQLTTILHTSSSLTKSLHSEGDIYLPTGQTLSLYKMDDVQPTSDRWVNSWKTRLFHFVTCQKRDIVLLLSAHKLFHNAHVHSGLLYHLITRRSDVLLSESWLTGGCIWKVYTISVSCIEGLRVALLCLRFLVPSLQVDDHKPVFDVFDHKSRPAHW